jgi:hypothetical protein
MTVFQVRKAQEFVWTQQAGLFQDTAESMT